MFRPVAHFERQREAPHFGVAGHSYSLRPSMCRLLQLQDQHLHVHNELELLPNEVKNAESLASFRRQLKTHLFKQAFLI